jgi:hypothetical protein
MGLTNQITENFSKHDDINRNQQCKVTVISNFHEDATISRSNMGYKYFTTRDFDVV